MTPAVTDSRTFSLTRAQMDIWTSHHVFPDPSVLNVPSVVDIHGPMNLLALRRAFGVLVALSETLRTIIVEEDRRPVARVLPATTAGDDPIDEVDMTAAGEGAVNQWLAQRVKRPLRLDSRTFDAAVVRLATNRTILYLAVHHAVADGASLRLLVNALAELYEQALAGDIANAMPLPAFSEYVRYEAIQRVSPETELAKQYWQECSKEPVAAPALYGRLPSRDRSRSFRVHCPLGTKRSAALYRAGEQLHSGVPSSNRNILAIMTACLAAWEWRVSGASPLAIGIPYHNRPPAFRATPGMFVNVVVVRVDLAGTVRFDEIVASLQEDLKRAFRHGHYPLKHSMHAPLYHAAVNYQVRPLVTRFGGNPAKRPVLFTGRLDEIVGLEMYRDPVTNAFELDIDFDGDIFSGRQAGTAIQHLLRIVDACLEDPQQPISRPEIVSTRERRHIVAWSHGPRTDVVNASCVDAMERCAAETPDAIAVVDGDRSITYRELTSAALLFALRLRRAGVSAGARVGVITDRSIEGMSAIVGVLRAGAVYVPVDRDWPDARVSFIVQDARIGCVVAAHGDRSRVKRVAPDATVVAWDELEAAEEDVATEVPRLAESDPAYVIFTSGSTGLPKGVEVSHGALGNHCVASIHAYRLTPSDRVLQFHSLTFDASLEEIFPTWCAGATLVLRPPERGSDFGSLEAFIAVEKVTVVDLPTSYWHEWTRMLLRRRATCPTTIRLIIVGGEQPSAQVYAEWRRYVGDAVTWINGYGPTEAAVTATVYEPARGSADDPLPMGRPVANTCAYVLDETRRLVPIGVPGELYLGGAGVAIGYVNRPTLTEQRFLSHRSSNGAERLYRTGDLARMRPDGQLEYLGRVDNQVKVHGYRVELGEVEAVLSRMPGVSTCAVVARDDRVGGKRLIAYVVPTGPAVDASDVRKYLSARLPDYMVPPLIVRLDSLPLTTSGKVDRASLPIPATVPPASAQVAPRTGWERALARMWEALLDCGPVGVHDDFFLSGGHSLMTVALICEIEKTLGVSLSIRDLYHNPTLERMAAVVERRREKHQPAPAVVQLQAGSEGPAIFLFNASSWELRLARLLGPERPIFGIEAPIPIQWMKAAARGNTAEMPTMAKLVAPFVSQLRAHRAARRCVLAGFSFAGLMAFEAARQLRHQESAVEMVILLDTRLDTRATHPLQELYAQVRRGDALGASAALRLSWRQVRARLAEEKARATSLVAVRKPDRAQEPGWFTGVYDENGRVVPSKLLVRLYEHAERSYRLESLDCLGILVRAEAADKEYAQDPDGTLGWKHLFTGGFETIGVPGTHRTMIEDDRNASTLAQRITSALDRLTTTRSSSIGDTNSLPDSPTARSKTEHVAPPRFGESSSALLKVIDP
jgi:amino acid adenylation domain-containing protein